MNKNIQTLYDNVVNAGTCTGCGLCIGIDLSNESYMKYTAKGPIPEFKNESSIADDILNMCPGLYINYPELYKMHFGGYPENWSSGNTEGVYIGYANDNGIRQKGASGGIITSVLAELLEKKIIDGAIIVKQGLPTAEEARVFIACTKEDIIGASQSVYIPVSTLDILKNLDSNKKYAITCLPDQSAALRKLQYTGNPKANAIKYILGPYTGTAIYPSSITAFLRSKNIKKNDPITSLKWRAGEWPGYLEIKTQTGRVLKSPKIYYNFLIPFYIAHTSLQQMDFCNEFADLAVGDAWSKKYESMGQGFSIVVARTKQMAEILDEMKNKNIISLSSEPTESALSMHGHMLDFKKRGSYIRNRFRLFFGKKAPQFGYKPKNISKVRILIEMVISLIFLFGRTRVARLIIQIMPEKLLGWIFNQLRLSWKKISKPAKRKGIDNFQIEIDS